MVETAGEDSLSASEGRIRLRTEDAPNAGSPPPPPQRRASIQRRRWYVSGGAASNPKSSFNESLDLWRLLRPSEAPLKVGFPPPAAHRLFFFLLLFRWQNKLADCWLRLLQLGGGGCSTCELMADTLVPVGWLLSLDCGGRKFIHILGGLGGGQSDQRLLLVSQLQPHLHRNVSSSKSPPWC